MDPVPVDTFDYFIGNLLYFTINLLYQIPKFSTYRLVTGRSVEIGCSLFPVLDKESLCPQKDSHVT